MKKIPVLLALALLSACAPDPDKSAAQEYVEAAKQTRTANALFEQAHFAEALKNFTQADAKIETILEKYPSSSIALKLVSENGVKVGDFGYDALRAKIIPSLGAITNPKLAKVSAAWAIASFAKTEAEKAAAFERIAREVAESDKFSAAEKAEIFDAVPVRIARPVLQTATQQPATAPAPKQTPQTLQKAEADKLLAEAKNNALYCSFNLSAAESLLEKAKIVPQQRRAEFSKILRTATEQADKISVVSLKEKAFAILAAAAAQVGDESLTLELLAKIKTPESLEKVFVTLAANLAKTRNYAAALGTVAKIKNPQTRDEFVKTLSENAAQNGRFDTATEVARQISALAVRNDVMAKIAVLAHDAQNGAACVAAVSNIDVSNLDCLRQFLKYAPASAEKSASSAATAAAKILLKQNAAISKALLDIAVKHFDNSPKTAVFIADILVKSGRSADALGFVKSVSGKLGSSAADVSVKTAICAAQSDPQKAEELLAEISRKTALESAANKAAFALDVQNSALSEDAKRKILGGLLKIK